LPLKIKPIGMSDCCEIRKLAIVEHESDLMKLVFMNSLEVMALHSNSVVVNIKISYNLDPSSIYMVIYKTFKHIIHVEFNRM
jgi:hypothetical protein